jgi:hypothetical protein
MNYEGFAGTSIFSEGLKNTADSKYSLCPRRDSSRTPPSKGPEGHEPEGDTSEGAAALCPAGTETAAVGRLMASTYHLTLLGI